MKLREVSNNSLNYTGIFFDDGTHMTWNFGRPLQYPEGVSPGDEATVTVFGKYEDDDVGCWVMTWNGHDKQPKGTLLHATFKVENGAKPVMSGQRATANGFERITPFKKTGIWR